MMLHHPAGAARPGVRHRQRGQELEIRAKINEMVVEATGQSVDKVHATSGAIPPTRAPDLGAGG